MPPANRTSQTRDLTTSLPHAVVPSWLVSRDGVLQMQGGGFAYDPGWQPRQKQTRSSSYHLGTAFAWLLGLFGPDRKLGLSQQECHHTFTRSCFDQGRTTLSTVCVESRTSSSRCCFKACCPRRNQFTRSPDALGTSPRLELRSLPEPVSNQGKRNLENRKISVTK